MTVFAGHMFATLSMATMFFQIALIAGVPLGAWAPGGQYPGRLPAAGRLMALLALAVTGFCALAILSAAGFAGGFWPHWTGWAAFAATGLNAVLTLVSPSEADRAVWAPATGVMTGLAGAVMITGP